MRATSFATSDQKTVCTILISEDAVSPWRPDKCIWLGQKYETAAQRETNRENADYISYKLNQVISLLQAELMEMTRDRQAFDGVFPGQMGQRGRRAAVSLRSFSSQFCTTFFIADISNFMVQCRIKWWCQEAAVRSVCTLSSPASLIKVGHAQPLPLHHHWTWCTIFGVFSRCFMLQHFQQLHGMIWRTAPCRRETRSTLRWG